MGLWMYDTYARDPSLPRHATHRVGSPGTPAVDPKKFVAVCSYYDAQVRFPERFTLALVEDARRVAAENNTEFRVLTYHRAVRRGTIVEVTSLDGDPSQNSDLTFEPAAIVNATGAWVDETLKRLAVESPPLIGGTKGSHFVTSQAKIRELLKGSAIYAEAPDGRPVFILPFGPDVLVGTTDLPFQGDPATAEATPDEIDYLLATVNRILPEACLTADDIQLHYCGVRPLPHVDESTPGAITRRHWMQEHSDTALPTFSVIGGKLTTCRSLAEESAAKLLARLGLPKVADSSQRMLPGAEAFPRDERARSAEWERLSQRFGVSVESIERITELVGTRAINILASLPDTAARGDRPVALLSGTALPKSFAAWIIQNEWVETLDDLVERRLMLVFHRDLPEACLRELAELLVAAGKLKPGQVDEAVEQTAARLQSHYGKRMRKAACEPGT
jgi:glycerol-3-phosphate dehydrogenase